MRLQPLIQALINGETVITPTNRLQRELLWIYAHQNQKTVHIQPHCYSFESFLQNWHHDLSFYAPDNTHALLLTPGQFYCLWKKIAQKYSPRPFNHFEIKQAISAYKNCALALTPPTDSDFLYTPCAELFQNIVGQLEKELQQRAWIAPAKLADFLIKYPFPKSTQHITWAFFDCFHPQQEQLLKHLSNQGIEHHFFDYPATPTIAHHEILAAVHEKAELEQMIAWIQEQYAQGKNRIGVVVPDLSQNASFLQKVLPLYIKPEILHFSLGKPLLEFPMIQQALSLLKLKPLENISKEMCKVLLLSPFIQATLSRHHVLQDSIFQEPHIPFHIFRQRTEEVLPFLRDIEDFPQAASPQEWITIFEKRLGIFGFPGTNYLQDETHQILSKFYDCIEQLNHIGLILQSISQEDVLSLLEKNCLEQIHQPPQNYHGVHIMGWLESSGFCGDALWICHFQSHLIPDATSLSPWLPIQWQKKHQLARTQRDKEFEMAERMLKRFIHAHAHAPVVISYAQVTQQEPQWPSTLLPHWPAYPLKEITSNPIRLEELNIPKAIPLIHHEVNPKGGYQILASVAKCPFQAFANYRLHTKQALHEALGFNASERGQMIHRVLQYIWGYFKDQSALIACDKEQLLTICYRFIDKTLHEFAQDRPYSLDSLLWELERQQLLDTILPSLEFDQTRPHFQIEGIEENIHLNIDGWPFQLRYDRLDRLENNELVIIDYKSKIPSPLPWTDERPIHPQILLYAIANMQIQHMLFLGLQASSFKHSGFGASDIGIENLSISKKNWVTMQQEWLMIMKNLMTEFRTGVCTPTPRNSNICQYCHNRDICRQEKLNESEFVEYSQSSI